jgi:hypothetical protein
MQLTRVRCRCGAWMVFVQNERKLGRVFPINAEPSDCSDPLATLGRVKPDLVGGQINVVRFVPAESRHEYRYLYVPHHVTCADERFARKRPAPGDRISKDVLAYQAEIESLFDWRESRGRA